MDPRVSWASFDQGDFYGAYYGFLKAQCGSPETPTYLLLAGIAATRTASVDHKIGPFMSLLQSYPESTEARTGMKLKPLAFAYVVRLAAEKGLSADVDAAVALYGTGYDDDRVVWLDESFQRLSPASEDVASRDFRPAGIPAPVRAVGAYYRALALGKSAASADREAARDLLDQELPTFQGQVLEQGVFKDLRQEGENLRKALRDDRPWWSETWNLYALVGILFTGEVLWIQRIRKKRRQARADADAPR